MTFEKENIAILIPVCSRKQNYKYFTDSSLFKKSINFLEKTKEPGYTYYVFIGVDDDDVFYNSCISKIHDTFRNIGVYSVIVQLTGFQHAPALVWGALGKVAYNTKSPVFDYFFQIGDDVEMISKNWTSSFIKKLKTNNNVGVVGPINITNYNQRKRDNIELVIENSFVHRTHLDIFKSYFPEEIRNWFCDNWITSVYRLSFCTSHIHKDIICTNTIRDARYDIERLDINPILSKSITKIHNYKIENKTDINEDGDFYEEKEEPKKKIFSFCLYGSEKKYCLGMLKNLQQIKEYYPDFETYIHMGNDVPDDYVNKIKEFQKVKIIPYDLTGAVLMTYRFFSIDDEDVSIMLLRDADSRITERCRWVINDFLNSYYKVFTIRDHRYHTSDLMAGQSGFKNVKPSFKHVYEKEWGKISKKYWDDKLFLNFATYYRYMEEFVVYTDIVKKTGENCKKIPLKRENEHDFCGNVILFDEDNNEKFEF